jgi:hypothetical protein
LSVKLNVRQSKAKVYRKYGLYFLFFKEKYKNVAWAACGGHDGHDQTWRGIVFKNKDSDSNIQQGA